MLASVTESSRLSYRRALEALRNGVPNQTAARLFGSNQPHIESRFEETLDKAADPEDRTGYDQGLMVSGGFGVGKSHLLAHLENLAISRNFVCSKVAISKETPLYDLGKVYRAAVEKARMPDRSGRLIEEIALAIGEQTESLEAFRRWTERAAANGVLSQMFVASLAAHENSEDPDFKSEIEGYWAGEPLKVAILRAGLRQGGLASKYKFSAPKAAELPEQRLRFAVELIKGAGYAGWIILLDEIELVGQYSILQRGRSYAEVARWMGQVPGETFPGLIVIGTVSDDFASYVIHPSGTKKDRDYIGPRLENHPRLNVIAKRAEAGMRILERNCIALREPEEDTVRATIETLREIYAKAYDWPAPAIDPPSGGDAIQRRMRYRVRSAVNRWDLLRLSPGTDSEIEITEYQQDYQEHSELEADATTKST